MNLEIYENEALPTPATFKAIADNERAILNSPKKTKEEQGQGDPTSSAMGMNQISQQQGNEIPSISNL